MSITNIALLIANESYSSKWRMHFLQFGKFPPTKPNRKPWLKIDKL